MLKSRLGPLVIISLSELFVLSLWFSASAILPELKLAWNLSDFTSSWVTASVQLGFIVGAFFSSFLGISDRLNSRKLFACSAIFGAFINFLLVFVSQASLGFFIRFLTGVSMAGIYPTAVKLVAQRYPKQRGMAIGILIGALTLGSALPHSIVAFTSGIDWKIVIIASSILALIGSSLMFLFVRDVTDAAKTTKIDLRLVGRVISNQKVMLANYGYFGHMWELYAMWTWLPAFLTFSFTYHLSDIDKWNSHLFAFLIIGLAGAVGCILGGYYADKIGKTRLTIIAMIVSGTCAVLIGFTLQFSIWLTIILAFLWGMSVIADSAQFSAIVTEYAAEEYTGTALTFQMAIGFLITVVSINLLPIVQGMVGWRWVFILLSIGPILGVISMRKLGTLERNSY
jgi:MFS family permease